MTMSRAFIDELVNDDEALGLLVEVLTARMASTSPAGPPARMLDATEAARRVNVSPEHLKRYARAGLVPGATKPGKAWRFPANIAETFDVNATRLPAAAPTITSRPRAQKRPPGGGSLADVVRGG